MPPLTVGPRANIKLSGTVLRGRPFSGAAAASGAGRSGAVVAPLPCGPVPALKLRHCHIATPSRGTSAPATCRQPSSGAVRSGGAHALAALPAVAKTCKVRGSRQVCHWGRLPMRPGGPHAGPPPPAKIHENVQSPQAATVPIFRVLVRFWLPMRPGGLPYAGAVPMPDAFPHTFSAVPHTGHLPIRFQRIPHTIHRLQKSDSNPDGTSVSGLRRPARQTSRICASSLHKRPTNQSSQIPRIRHPHIPNQNPQIHVHSCTATHAQPNPPRPAAGPPRSTHPTDPLKFPATTGPLKPTHPTGLTTFPAPAAGLLKPTRPANSLKLPAPARGAWA